VKLDVLAIGPHPDDVELGCGGTLALLSAAGKRTGILHLTRGEAGTRGTAEERVEEARGAAAALGAEMVEFLDCGDGALRTGLAEEDALIEALRTYRPEMVLGPPPQDRHPDHGRSHQLVEAASFYAGLASRKTEREEHNEPHRPAAVFHYMQHDIFEPRFIVDVTSAWEAKLEALAAYESQLHQGGSGDEVRDEPITKVASQEFRAAVEGRARHFGMLIGAEFGEPFGSRQPVAVGDPWHLLPRGLR
jgi:bacillithiol biosynthesis deacetylase BshB1